MHQAIQTWLTRLFSPLVIPGFLAALTLIFMLAFIRPPTGREALDGSDLVNQQYPLFSLIFDSVRDGRGLPLWNPYQFAGQSIVANPQSTVYYPPAWLMAPFGVPRTVGWLILLHLWIGIWGMERLARQFGATRGGALIGGMVYGFSAVFAAHIAAGHFNYLLCQAWLPWLGVAYLWSSKQRRWFLAALPGAAFLGLTILTGYPPLLYFAVLLLGFLWLYLAWHDDATLATLITQGLRALRPLSVILLGGAILGAAMLLPVGQFALQSARDQAASLAFSNSFAMPGGQLITLIFPNMFGQPNLAGQGYWGLPFYQETTAYFGILPLAALFLVHRLRQRKAAVLLFAFVIIGLVISLGIDGGLFPLLYWLLPGYSLFRVPGRSFYFVIVGVAGLSALFITDLQFSERSMRAEWLRPITRWLLPMMAGFALVLSAAMLIYFMAHNRDSNPPWRVLYSGQMVGLAILMILISWIALRLWQSGHKAAFAVTMVALLVDLWHISQPLITVSAIDVPSQWKTVASMIPASPDYRVMTIPDEVTWQAGATYTHHLNASGYDPLVSGNFQRLLDASEHNPTSPISRLLGVRFAITQKPYEWLNMPGINDLKPFGNKDGWYVYEVQNPLPRIFTVRAIRVIPDDEVSREQISVGMADPLTTAIVDHPVQCAFNSLHQPKKATGRIVYYSPNAVDVKGAGPGILVFTDSYDANWTVTVDGAPAELLRVDTALRGVCLNKGWHHAHFEYHPTAFAVGVAASAVGWILLGLFGVGLITARTIRYIGKRWGENTAVR